jgi:hypothetical protein
VQAFQLFSVQQTVGRAQADSALFPNPSAGIAEPVHFRVGQGAPGGDERKSLNSGFCAGQCVFCHFIRRQHAVLFSPSVAAAGLGAEFAVFSAFPAFGADNGAQVEPAAAEMFPDFHRGLRENFRVFLCKAQGLFFAGPVPFQNTVF